MECGICFETFDTESHTPLALPCQHTFCRSCVEGLPVQANVQMSCPVCRACFRREQALVNLGLRDALEEFQERRRRPESCSMSPVSKCDAHTGTRLLVVKGTEGKLTKTSEAAAANPWVGGRSRASMLFSPTTPPALPRLSAGSISPRTSTLSPATTPSSLPRPSAGSSSPIPQRLLVPPSKDGWQRMCNRSNEGSASEPAPSPFFGRACSLKDDESVEFWQREERAVRRSLSCQ